MIWGDMFLIFLMTLNTPDWKINSSLSHTSQWVLTSLCFSDQENWCNPSAALLDLRCLNNNWMIMLDAIAERCNFTFSSVYPQKFCVTTKDLRITSYTDSCHVLSLRFSICPNIYFLKDLFR